MSKANRTKRQRGVSPTPPRPSASLKRTLGGKGLIIGAVLALGIAGAVAVLALRGGGGGGSHAEGAPSVAGLQKGAAPWQANDANLTARLHEAGVPFSNMAATALHLHPRLAIAVDGRQVAIPANIGISPGQQAMGALHTHDASGTIHVESPVVRSYTLGEFFDVWGVRLTKSCLGGYCANGTKNLAAFVDGKTYANDPRKIALADGEQILLAYGTPAEIAHVAP